MKVFIYEDDFKLGHGMFACVDGFRLAEHPGHERLEAIKDSAGCVYGTIYEMDEMSLDMMDLYYGVGVMHNRIPATAKLQGGDEVEVQMYEFIHVELV